mgnify:CR=1 FL=1
MKKVNVLSTNLQDVKIIEMAVYGDHRGFFTESYTKEKFAEAGITIDFIQDNHSLSVEPGVLRGMHFQRTPKAQTKIVRAVTGVIYDVLVDMRKGSPTYGKWEGYILSEYNHRQLLVPKGFAHGFLVLSETATFFYKCDNFYNKESEGGLIYNDQTVNINWNFPLNELIISDKDQILPNLENTKKVW